MWMVKYDKDVEAKQHELDVLKASKAKDLERLQELTKLVCTRFNTSSTKKADKINVGKFSKSVLQTYIID